jgi:hypothetical protein
VAFFKYKGEPARNFVTAQGPTLSIRVPLKDGSVQEFLAVDQVNGWQVNDQLPEDFSDERALRALRADPRFEEV